MIGSIIGGILGVIVVAMMPPALLPYAIGGLGIGFAIGVSLDD